MIRTLAVENYRSLRHLVLPLGRLNVVTGANGSGKSSLYRALRLLADSSRNGSVAALAREGGLESTLWAGPEVIGGSVRRGEQPLQGTVRKNPVSLKLGFAGDVFGYAMDLGLPAPGDSVFARDPLIKVEATWSGPVLRPATLLAQRHGQVVQIRERGGQWYRAHTSLLPFDSMLSEVSDPQRAPDLLDLREQMRSWRFYDHVRTDAAAPARIPQVGTRTPVMSADGSDVAAALETIYEIGDHAALNAAVERGFPGSTLEIAIEGGRFQVGLRQPGMLRPLLAPELSDGTLRYLLWCAALLTPRPPELLVLNEPETSLHPDLLEALADLIAVAAAKTQIIVVTHAPRLVAALAKDPDHQILELFKDFGETRLQDQLPLEEPLWHWPKRLEAQGLQQGAGVCEVGRAEGDDGDEQRGAARRQFEEAVAGVRQRCRAAGGGGVGDRSDQGRAAVREAAAGRGPGRAARQLARAPLRRDDAGGGIEPAGPRGDTEAHNAARDSPGQFDQARVAALDLPARRSREPERDREHRGVVLAGREAARRQVGRVTGDGHDDLATLVRGRTGLGGLASSEGEQDGDQAFAERCP